MRSLAEDDGIGRRAASITILLPFLSPRLAMLIP